MKKEIWKDIPDYEGIYQASNLGKIRTSPNKTTFTLRHGIRKWKTRILKGRGHSPSGFRVSLWKDGKSKDWLVARLIAISFLGKPKYNIDTVNHKNGNRFDNRLENLEWLSLGDNIRHAFDNGLMPCKKVKLYNKDCELFFRSLSMASIYLGRNNKYLWACIKHNRKITNDKKIEFFLEFV